MSCSRDFLPDSWSLTNEACFSVAVVALSKVLDKMSRSLTRSSCFFLSCSAFLLASSRSRSRWEILDFLEIYRFPDLNLDSESFRFRGNLWISGFSDLDLDSEISEFADLDRDS